MINIPFIIKPKNLSFYNECINICDTNFGIKENFIPLEIRTRNFIFHFHCGDLVGAIKFDGSSVIDGFVLVDFREDHMRIGSDTMVETLLAYGFMVENCAVDLEEEEKERLVLT